MLISRIRTNLIKRYIYHFLHHKACQIFCNKKLAKYFAIPKTHRNHEPYKCEKRATR